MFADRGFTAHEYLEDFKLYNMNGRLYDPVVGRFLNADPFIQDPGNTQSYNRYSYCLNNPLKYADPSGNILYEPSLDRSGGNNVSPIFNYNFSGGGAGSNWFSAYTNVLMDGYTGGADAFLESYHNQLNSSNYDGTMNFHYFTHHNKEEETLEPGCNLRGVTAYSIRHDFTININLGGGSGYANALYLANTINSLYNESAAKNLNALAREATGWIKVARKVPGKIDNAMKVNKFTKVITKSIGKKLFGVGLAFSAIDMYQDPSGSNIAWNMADNIVGWAAFVPGLQIPALIYFTGRISYDIYQEY